jgi:hypothetical protein
LCKQGSLIMQVKQVPGYPSYLVSDTGLIINQKTGKTTYGHKTSSGYLRVLLANGDAIRTVLVHRLVAEAFSPNIFGLPQVNHLNGIKHDNNVADLEWCTASENMQHAYDSGLIAANKGSRHHLAKLTVDKARKIMAARGPVSSHVLAAEYGVSLYTIRAIWQRKVWRHATS